MKNEALLFAVTATIIVYLVASYFAGNLNVVKWPNIGKLSAWLSWVILMFLAAIIYHQ